MVIGYLFQNCKIDLALRIYASYLYVMKERNKRKVKTYKIDDSVYKKALERGRKISNPLACIIEEMVTGFAEGKNVYLSDKNSGYSRIN